VTVSSPPAMRAPSGPAVLGGSRRTLARLLAVVSVVVGGLMAMAGTAAAHPTLLFTDPPADSAIAEPPTSVTFVFNEAVTIGEGAIRVLGPDGRALSTEPPTTGRDGRAVLARLPGTGGRGEYRVQWRVTGTDGDVVEGEFGFVVGVAPAGASAAGTGAGIAWPTAVFRWLLFAGLAVALGGAAASRFTRSARDESAALPPVRPWLVPGGLLAAVGAGGLAAALVAGDGFEVLWRDRPGQIVVVELAASLLALLLGLWGRRGWSAAALLLVVAAEGVRSHAEVAVAGWGAVLTGVHLVAAAVWVGALLHVARAAWTWRPWPPAVRWVLLGYARMALWLVVAVVATGTISAMLLVPLPALTTTMYGRVLLVKLALVASAVGLAVLGRRALRGPDDRLGRLQRTTRLEGAALAGVLAVTATLVSAPPASAAQSVPAPAPVGIVVPIGDLAGQVGVSASASEGQIVVRLVTPRRGDYYGPPQRTEYQLTASLADPGGDQSALTFRDCGDGCFVAMADWAAGENLLSLRVAAEGWQGGTTAARVSWPPHPGDELVPAVAMAMRAAGEFEVFESVTSDTSQPMPEPILLRLDGETFLAGEPYASGEAPIAVQTSGGSQVRLAMGFPAERRFAALTLDDRGRIAEEMLTDPKHLVRRHFVYADH
jgi:copper transport protein